MRFELMTSSLPRRRSTPELRGQFQNGHENWSGRRDSNSRPSAWKADALPTELHPPNSIADCQMSIANLKTPRKRFELAIGNRQLAIPTGAGGRIRTYVGREP